MHHPILRPSNHLNVCALAIGTDLAPRRFDNLGRVDPLAGMDDRAGVNARHLETVLEQSRETLDLADDQVGLFIALESVSHDACRLPAATRIVVSGVRRSCASEASSVDLNSALRWASSAWRRSSRKWMRSIAMATTLPRVSSVSVSIARPAVARMPSARVPSLSGTRRIGCVASLHTT